MAAIHHQHLYLFHLSHHGSHLDVYSIMNPNLSLLCHTISSTFDHFCLEYPCVSWANSSLTARIANSLHHLDLKPKFAQLPKNNQPMINPFCGVSLGNPHFCHFPTTVVLPPSSLGCQRIGIQESHGPGAHQRQIRGRVRHDAGEGQLHHLA